MELVLAAEQLHTPGGVQSYLLTIAPQLERLGHGVTLYAGEIGLMADVARERGMQVVRWEHELPERCDAVLAQDGAMALTMADRYPDAVRMLVVHGSEYDLCLPVRLDGLISRAVAMNGAVERRLRALAKPPPIVRLRQPIETTRLFPAGAIQEHPRSVLMLGNYLTGRRLDELVGVCEDAGIRWRQVGVHGELLTDPLGAIAEADIVIGQGRSLLDAMAYGRAAWVYGPSGGDGWVTADSYEALEDDGFRGRATSALPNADSFRQALEEYNPAMGETNRCLVVQHHSAYDHAVELAMLLADDGAQNTQPAGGPLRELARLVRIQHNAEARVGTIANEMRIANEGYRALEEEHRVAHERHGQEHQALLEEDKTLRAGLLEEQRKAEEQRIHNERELDARNELIDELERRLAAIIATRRWRVAGLVARPLDTARRLITTRKNG